MREMYMVLDIVSIIYIIRMFVLRLYMYNLEWQWIRTPLILLWFRQLKVWVLALTKEPVYLLSQSSQSQPIKT